MLSGKKVLQPLPVHFLPLCGSPLSLQGLHFFPQPSEKPTGSAAAADAASMAIKVCRVL